MTSADGACADSQSVVVDGGLTYDVSIAADELQWWSRWLSPREVSGLLLLPLLVSTSMVVPLAVAAGAGPA